jgi:hypothetical protein
MSDQNLSVGADAFRWRGLGKTAWRVWAALPRQCPGISADTLRSQLRINSRTLRRVLLRLHKYGLAEIDGSGRWRALERDLDEVAEEVGRDGVGERQREFHRAERLLYRVARQRRDARRSGGTR